MADISSTGEANSQLAQLNQQYEKQRKELKKEYDEELSQIRETNTDRLAEERHAGDAAVNHIKKDVSEKVHQADKSADEQQKILETQNKLKRDSLSRTQNSQEAYVDQVKRKQAAWVQSQMNELSEQKNHVDENTNKQIEGLKTRANERVSRANDKIRSEQAEVNSSGSEKLQAMRDTYTKRSEALDSKEQKSYGELRDAHQRQLDAEKKSFSSAANKEKQAEHQEIEQDRNSFTNEKEKIKTDTAREMDRERQLSNYKIQKTQKEGNQALSSERARYQKGQQELRESQQKNLTTMNAKNQGELMHLKQKHELEVKQEDGTFKKDMEMRSERHTEQREKTLNLDEQDLEHLEKGHEDRMLGSEVAFEKRFQANEVAARRTYSDQALDLGRELVNQKSKFVKASDKYSNKSSDPFYQIRDNKTGLHETSGAYIFTAKVPEHEKDNIYVRVKQGKLTLSGNRNFDDKIEDEGHVMNTSNVQTFQESYALPKRVREDEILKNYDNGELTVIIPKV